MTRARKCLTALALFGAAALGCNGLLGIDDGAYAPDTDSGISSNPSETGTSDGGPLTDAPSSIDAPTDTNLPKTDAGNELLAQDQNGVTSLVQDDDNLYWLSNGFVMTVPKSGAAAPRSVVSVTGATLIAVDPGSATTGNVYVAAANIISSIPKNPGATTMPANIAMLGANRTAVAMGSDGTSLLFIDYYEDGDEAVVRRMPKGGGAMVTLPATGSRVALLGVTKTWAAYIDDPDQTSRRIYEFAPPGAASSTSHGTAQGVAVYDEFRNMFLDDSKMYWLDSATSNTALRTHDKGASTNMPGLIATFSFTEGAFRVVASGGKAYVLLAPEGTPGVGEVVRVEAGGPRISIVKNVENGTGLVVSGKFVYVAEDKPLSKGTVQKVSLP